MERRRKRGRSIIAKAIFGWLHFQMSLSSGRDRIQSRPGSESRMEISPDFRKASHSLLQEEREPFALNSEEWYNTLIQQWSAGFDLKEPFQSYVPMLWQTMIHSFPTQNSCRARYLAVKSLGFRMYPFIASEVPRNIHLEQGNNGKF